MELWLKQVKVYNAKLRICSNSEMNGKEIVANELLESNQVIFKIPKHCMLHTGLIQDWPMKLVKNELFAKFPSIQLTLLLMVHRFVHGETSFFHPYLENLPQQVVLPFYHDIELLADLKCSVAYRQVLDLKRNIEKQYWYLSKLFMDMEWSVLSQKHFTFENYQWAMAIVLSRKNTLPDGSMALVPYWDLCNHKFGHMNTEYTSDDELVCRTMERVLPGESVYMDYGPRSNAQLFAYSGFVLDYNPHDIVYVHVPWLENDRYGKLREIIIVKQQSGNIESRKDGVQVPIGHDKQKYPILLYLVCMNKEELGQFLRQDDKTYIQCQVSTDTITQMKVSLTQACRRKLKEYPNVKRSHTKESSIQNTMRRLLMAEINLLHTCITEI